MLFTNSRLTYWLVGEKTYSDPQGKGLEISVNLRQCNNYIYVTVKLYYEKAINFKNSRVSRNQSGVEDEQNYCSAIMLSTEKCWNILVQYGNYKINKNPRLPINKAV